MSIRRDPIYISHDVWRRLRLIAKATPSKSDAMSIQTATPDQIADELLNEMIKERFPQLLEHFKQIDKLESDAIKTLGQHPPAN